MGRARAKLIQVTSVEQTREMKFAREARLALRDIRVNAEKARKRLKEDSVRKGRAIDGFANVIKALIEPIESHLLEQETFAARAEEARKNALRESRSAELVALGVDPTSYANLGEHDDATWSSIHETARLAHERKLEQERHAEQVRVEAERITAEKAEAARVELARLESERVERERVAAEENARLRREAQDREVAMAKERVEAAAEKAKIEMEARLERERLEEQAKHAREQEDQARRELAAKQRQEEEQAKKKADDEARAEKAKLEAEARAKAAPDREKLVAIANQLRSIVPHSEAFSTDWGQAAAKKIGARFHQLANLIEQKGGEL